MKIGDIVRINGMKRVCGYIAAVKDTQDERVVTVKKAYIPSPKSKFQKGRTAFSKLKGKLINSKTKQTNT